MHALLVLYGAHRAVRVRPIKLRSSSLYAVFTFFMPWSARKETPFEHERKIAYARFDTPHQNVEPSPINNSAQIDYHFLTAASGATLTS